MACASNLPSLNYFAASKFMALWISGCISMLWSDWIIYMTFLLGCHSFSPTIYLQISPSFTFGCHIAVLNLIIGNLNGNCYGKSNSISKSCPSYGDPKGPFKVTSQWNRFSLCLTEICLNRMKCTLGPWHSLQRIIFKAFSL